MPMEKIPYRVPDKKKASPAPVQPSNPYGTMEKIPFRVPDKKKASPVPASPAPANASGVTDLSKLTTSSSPIALMDYRKGLAEGNTSATTRSVGTNELSATQLNNLLSGNSKYIQNARLSGAEDAASRGLGTSSYSAGLSERAELHPGCRLRNKTRPPTGGRQARTWLRRMLTRWLTSRMPPRCSGRQWGCVRTSMMQNVGVGSRQRSGLQGRSLRLARMHFSAAS